VEATIAALGFAVFSLTMTIGRLAGDRVTSRYSPVMLVRTGGLIAAAGLLLAIIVPETATALIGFAAVGLGLSVVIPLAFSAAGSFPNIPPGSGIAGVATIGYAGFLAGPPVIGLLSDAVSLPTALVLVVIMLTTLAFTAGALRVLQTNRAAQHAAGS
jgi:MFS family permease